jgi:hypothetical protein
MGRRIGWLHSMALIYLVMSKTVLQIFRYNQLTVVSTFIP